MNTNAMNELDSRELNEYQLAVLDYAEYKQAENSKPSYIRDLRQRLLRIGRLAELTTLADITTERLMAWFVALGRIDLKTGKPVMATSTRKNERKYISTFCEWLIAMGKLSDPNPANRLPRPKQKGEFSVRRRAMKQEELQRLLRVARLKPQAEYARRRSLRIANDRGGWSDCAVTYANLEAYAIECQGLLAKNPKYLAQLQREGRHRELVYRCLMLTGLRRNEIRTLTASRIRFDGQPRIELEPRNEKNSKGTVMPIPLELAMDIKAWIEDRKISSDGLVFAVPLQLVKTFHRDCIVAGIERKDGLGRQVDIHAMRGSYNMLLYKAKVEPRTRQRLMRHSRPDLTEVTYFDEEQLCLGEAVQTLPSFSAKPLPPSVAQSVGLSRHSDSESSLSNAKPNVFKAKGSCVVSVSVSNVRGPKMVKKSSFVGRYEMVSLERVDGTTREKRMLVVQGSHEDLCRFYEAVKDSLENAVNAITMKDGFTDDNDLPVAAVEDDMLNWRTDPMEVAAYEKAKANAKHEGLLRFAATESRFTYEGDPWSWVAAVESAIRSTGLEVALEAQTA